MLQPAVDAAASGDTILIGPGWYQEMHWISNLAGDPIQVFAYWNGLKDLVLIGEGVDETILGPETYSPFGFSPTAIFSENSNSVSATGIAFQNLYVSILNAGATNVQECSFNNGGYGIGVVGSSSSVRRCSFSQLDCACFYDRCDTAIVSDCEMVEADVYFGTTDYGEVRDCTFTGDGVGGFYSSAGVVANNTVVNGGEPGLVCSRSVVEVFGNSFSGGSVNLSVDGTGCFVEAYDNLFWKPEGSNIALYSYGSLLAYNNDIYRETLGSPWLLRTYFYDEPSDAYIDVRNNYWGPLDSTEHFLNLRILDGNDDPDLHIIVEYDPFSTVPLETEKESLGGFKAMFR